MRSWAIQRYSLRLSHLTAIHVVRLPASVESLSVMLMGCNNLEAHLWEGLPNLQHLDLTDDRSWPDESHGYWHWPKADLTPIVSAKMLRALKAVPEHSACWYWHRSTTYVDQDGIDMNDQALLDLFDTHGFECHFYDLHHTNEFCCELKSIVA